MKVLVSISLLMLAYGHSGTPIAQRNRQPRETNQQVAASPSPTASVQPTIEKIEAKPSGDESNRSHNVTVVDERSSWPAWIANAISVFVLLFLAYQTYVNRGMLRSMRENEGFLKMQCDALSAQSETMKRELDAMQKQAGFIEAQARTMADSLTETRKIVEHNEKVFEASRQHSVKQIAVMELQANVGAVHARVADRTAAAAEKSAEAAQRSVEVMRESAITTTRAYIGIREITVRNLVVGEIPTLYVIWHNGGQTPAFRFRANVYLVFGDAPEWKGYFINDDFSDSKANFLPPGPSSSPVLYPQDEYGFKSVTKQFLDDLNGGSKRLYAMVSAVYLDFTDDIREFQSSYIFNPSEGTFTDLYEYGVQDRSQK